MLSLGPLLLKSIHHSLRSWVSQLPTSILPSFWFLLNSACLKLLKAEPAEPRTGSIEEGSSHGVYRIRRLRRWAQEPPKGPEKSPVGAEGCQGSPKHGDAMNAMKLGKP